MMWDGNGFGDHGASWGAGGWLMGIGMIALIVVAVVLVVYLARTMTHQPAATIASGPYQHCGPYGIQGTAGSTASPVPQVPGTTPGVETSRDIVQRRYAAGEIDRDEYLRKLADL